MSDLFSYIVIAGIFLGGMVPIVAGIIYYVKENKRLDHEAALDKKRKEEDQRHYYAR
ncbi:hypothetical protein [Chryseolinea lacunae]|uniref:Uncharacterized protein n=1 Tax=Chryseolinea lacunae TaxID=2801331 RepID=A0ABS1KU94_9BACT|nr:hypothetical protein [Chryseolinea lacunae]MBL0742868.1 hypothetical protein [Chryseolinea lacunae]